MVLQGSFVGGAVLFPVKPERLEPVFLDAQLAEVDERQQRPKVDVPDLVLVEHELAYLCRVRM